MTHEEIIQSIKGALVLDVKGDEEDARLTLDDGRTLKISLYAGCVCSSSFFTDPNQFRELVGAKILGIEFRDGKSSNALPDSKDPEYDVWEWAFLVFTTDKGHVTIDWRNESNGYYSGWVEMNLLLPPTEA